MLKITFGHNQQALVHVKCLPLEAPAILHNFQPRYSHAHLFAELGHTVIVGFCLFRNASSTLASVFRTVEP